MHITLETDYAVRIVYCLAVNRDQKRMDAKTIAEHTGVTLRFSLKILRKLVACGIVRSFKGTQGGYELAKPLDEITLYDVIETVEGPFVMSRCLNPDFSCPRNEEGICKFHVIYRDISQVVREKLKEVRFSDLVQ